MDTFLCEWDDDDKLTNYSDICEKSCNRDQKEIIKRQLCVYVIWNVFLNECFS